jgi:hypothetical protein
VRYKDEIEIPLALEKFYPTTRNRSTKNVISVARNMKRGGVNVKEQNK